MSSSPPDLTGPAGPAAHPSVLVREAGPDDLDTIVAMNHAMAFETEGLALDLDRLRAGVAAGLRDPGRARYLLACRANGGGAQGGEVLGQLMLTTEWSDWRAATFWWIQSVYVRPEVRRRGVYRTLYAHVLAAARGRDDVCGVRLYVHRHNAPAQATYATLGMVRAPYELFEVDLALRRG